MPDFIDELDQVPWFAHLFEPTDESGINTLPDWDAWPGPTDPRVEEIHFRQQEAHDALLAASERPEELKAHFDQVHARVIELTRSKVPFDEKADSWHAPTMAVWHAAWTAGLMALYEYCRRAPDPEIEAQWRWFVQGRWPACAVTIDTTGALRDFIVM